MFHLVRCMVVHERYYKGEGRNEMSITWILLVPVLLIVLVALWVIVAYNGLVFWPRSAGRQCASRLSLPHPPRHLNRGDLRLASVRSLQRRCG